MFWKWFTNSPFPPPAPSFRIDELGPDAPQIKFKTTIVCYGYDQDTGHLKMTLEIGDTILTTRVPASIQRKFPLGSRVEFVLTKKE